jgi:hypothetical protein
MTNQTSALPNPLNISQTPSKTTVIWKQCNEYAGYREAITFAEGLRGGDTNRGSRCQAPGEATSSIREFRHGLPTRHGELECRFPSSPGRGTLSLEGEPEFHQFVTTFLEVFV